MKAPQDYIDELVSDLRSSEYLADKADPGCKLALILGQAHRMIRTLVEELKASELTPDPLLAGTTENRATNEP